MSTIRPLRDLLYVRRHRPKKSPGGLHLPESFDHGHRPSLKHGAVGDTFEAEVLAIGPLIRDVEVGARLLVHTYAAGDGTKLYTGEGDVERGECMFIRPDDIVCVLGGGPT